MLVLDSDIIIDYLRNVSETRRRIEREKTIATTCFNAVELWRGVQPDSRNAQTLRKFFSQISIIGFNEHCVDHAVHIMRWLSANGGRIGAYDELIAAVCLAEDAPILTRNVKHFSKVPGLKVVSV